MALKKEGANISSVRRPGLSDTVAEDAPLVARRSNRAIKGLLVVYNREIASQKAAKAMRNHLMTLVPLLITLDLG